MGSARPIAAPIMNCRIGVNALHVQDIVGRAAPSMAIPAGPAAQAPLTASAQLLLEASRIDKSHENCRFRIAPKPFWLRRKLGSRNPPFLAANCWLLTSFAPSRLP